MPIWQLCANLLIPNCLRSNLSYSPLAALELYVKKTNFKLILYNVGGQRHPQLFDLEADPMEMNNLYDDPNYSKKRDELTALLYARMKAVGDFCDPAKPDWGYPVKLKWNQVIQVNP